MILRRGLRGFLQVGLQLFSQRIEFVAALNQGRLFPGTLAERTLFRGNGGVAMKADEFLQLCLTGLACL